MTLSLIGPLIGPLAKTLLGRTKNVFLPLIPPTSWLAAFEVQVRSMISPAASAQTAMAAQQEKPDTTTNENEQVLFLDIEFVSVVFLLLSFSLSSF